MTQINIRNQIENWHFIEPSSGLYVRIIQVNGGPAARIPNLRLKAGNCRSFRVYSVRVQVTCSRIIWVNGNVGHFFADISGTFTFNIREKVTCISIYLNHPRNGYSKFLIMIIGTKMRTRVTRDFLLNYVPLTWNYVRLMLVRYGSILAI